MSRFNSEALQTPVWEGASRSEKHIILLMALFFPSPQSLGVSGFLRDICWSGD